MKVTVLGVQKVDYISKKSGEPVKGVSLHCSFKDQAVDGDAVESYFISDRLNCYAAYDAKPGDQVDLVFNRRGYVQDVILGKK